MLKFFFRRKKQQDPDTPWDQQQDPYLENLVETLRQALEESKKVPEPLTEDK